jgi:protocatechuate 3,4-dioxygenase alpha subunit
VTPTPSQTVGPFFAIGLVRREQHVLADDGLELRGTLLDGQGDPIVDGVIELLDGASGAWGRSGTDGEGRFSFRVPRDATRLEAYVFARGLLRHQLTRIYLDGGADAEDETLVAARDGDEIRFDIRMQGDRATAFFEH